MPVELDDSYESLLDRAVQQMAMGKSQDAIDLVLRVVNRLSKLSAETLASKPLSRATLMNAWQIAVEFLRWEKRLDEAVAVCERLNAAHPELGEVSIRIHTLRIERGEVEQGLAGLRQAVEHADQAHSWTVLGIQLRELGQPEQAEVCLKKALARADNDDAFANAHLELFMLYRSQHRLVQALESWDMAATLWPEQADNANVLYRWLIEEGEIERAQSYLRRERNPVWREFFAGLIDWHGGQTVRASNHWRQVLNTQIDEGAPALVEWLEAALRLGEADVVSAEIERQLDSGNTPPPFAWMIDGLACALTGRIDDAHSILADVVRMLERRWPSHSGIEGWWPLVTDVISDPDTRSALAGYFDQGEAQA